MRSLLLFVMLLSGCATFDPAARAAREQRLQEQAEQEQIAYVNRLGNQCITLGYQRGSPDMKHCMLQLHQSAQQEQQANRTNALNYLLANQPRQPTQTNCVNTIVGVQCNTR